MSNDIGDVFQQASDASRRDYRWELKFTWVSFKDQKGDFYVNEHCSAKRGFDRWGPMPERVVEEFIATRKVEIDATRERMSKLLEQWHIGVSKHEPDGSLAPDTRKAGD